MPEFAVNKHRRQPYSQFKFRVQWDGRIVAGVSAVSALTRTTEVVAHRAGGAPNVVHRSPGRTRFEPITLERGITHDVAFEEWANLVHVPGGPLGEEVALRAYRKEVVLQLMNEAGQVVLAYFLHGAWVSKFTAVPDLDANGAAVVAIESIELQVESWERDTAVTEPSEPSGRS